MKAFTLFAAILVAGVAQADDRCSIYGTCEQQSDYYGADDRVWRGSTDYFGNETWRDNRGNSVRGTTDYRGNETYRDRRGNSVTCREDYRGDVVCRERPANPYR